MKIFSSLFIIFTVVFAGCISQTSQEVNINLMSCVPVTYSNNIIGSGVVVKCTKKDIEQNEYIIDVLTAKHVAVIPDLRLVINNVSLKVESIYHDTLDVAILRCVSASPVAPVRCQFSDPRPLDVVYTVGYPLGISQVVTIGIINQSVTNIAEGGWLCSSPAMPGNSGGGVFNNKGELLGITIAIVMISSNNTEIPVPHLQIFIPISKFSSWLKGEAHV
jgi:S1-C subfamily serine protease